MEESPKRRHLPRSRRDAHVQLLRGERDGTRIPDGEKKPNLLGSDVFAVHDRIVLNNGASENAVHSRQTISRSSGREEAVRSRNPENARQLSARVFPMRSGP